MTTALTHCFRIPCILLGSNVDCTLAPPVACALHRASAVPQLFARPRRASASDKSPKTRGYRASLSRGRTLDPTRRVLDPGYFTIGICPRRPKPRDRSRRGLDQISYVDTEVVHTMWPRR